MKFIGKGDPAWEIEIPACEEGFDPGQHATMTCSQGRFGAEMGSDQFGGCIMAHHPEKDQQFNVIKLENVELEYVGQAYR